MTKTQPNRTIIFITNLWVNRVRQLTILAVALFFYSCVDDTNLIGFKPPNSKFDVKYVEISLDSSMVFLSDSIYTRNNQIAGSGDTERFLVGVYNDPKFGLAKSMTFAQYYRNSTPDTIKALAVFDSLELFLQFDYYAYGSAGITPERYYIHELTDTISSLYLSYYNNSTIPYNPTPIGVKDTLVSFDYFKTQAAKSTGKDTLTIRTKLSQEFGQKLFDFAKNNRTNFLDDSTAKVFFKGIAIVPDDNNSKIVGFAPNGMVQGTATPLAYSKMVLHYHDDEDTLKFGFVFNGYRRASFNNITIDRSSSSELSGHPLYTSFIPNDDLVYSQSGDGVITSIDFKNFYNFITDSIKDGPIIINSGELVMDGVEQNSTLAPVNSFILRALDDNNHFKTNKTEQDALDLKLYQLSTGISTLDAQFNVLADVSTSAMVIPYKENVYKSHLTLFLQELSKKEEGKTRFRNFGLIPISPARGKSVNRTLINRNNIKLRIYYTLPTVTD
ncbi:MAG: DUF4270 family protein [Chryseolinea sp.]